jgi:hypothetical protein
LKFSCSRVSDAIYDPMEISNEKSACGKLSSLSVTRNSKAHSGRR